MIWGRLKRYFAAADSAGKGAPESTEEKEIVQLLDWYGQIHDEEIREKMTKLTVIMLFQAFILLPLKGEKPNPHSSLQKMAQLSDAWTRRAMVNLRKTFLLCSRNARTAIRELALAALSRATDESVLQAVFWPAQALKIDDSFDQAVAQLIALKQEHIRAVEECLSKHHAASLNELVAHIKVSSSDCIHTVAGMAITEVHSVLLNEAF